MNRRLLISVLTFCIGIMMLPVCHASHLISDSLPGEFSGKLPWRIGMEVAPAYVLPTNTFLQGDNIFSHRVDASLTTTLRGDFCFNPRSRTGMLYHGLYQGVGVDIRTFFSSRLLATPVSLYVYQGAPFKHFTKNLWLGYEWRFGAAMGWEDRSGDRMEGYLNSAISTRVTAHMGVSLKLHYKVSDRFQLTAGVDATHFSNGNTSFPNSGINTIGVSLGASYLINGGEEYVDPDPELISEADKSRWMWDILAYGAWRRRHVIIEGIETLLPKKYGVGGIQFSPMIKINRWFSAGMAVDLQYDHGAGLEPYWEGGYYDNAVFGTPSFHEKIRVGAGGIAELTMPVFKVGAGLGYDIVSPKGDMRFFQQLYIKAFVTHHVYLNVGYRLGNFKDPQNLMLGVGVRL